MNHTLGLAIESLVSLLLLLTILYCVTLNRQLKRLKGDEAALKATIAELLAASAGAERAIAGLKVAVQECERGLGERVRRAEQLSDELERQFVAGETLCSRVSRIVAAAQPAPAATQPETAPSAVPAPTLDTKAILAAAQAFADRARSRVRSAAA